ncbi:MAG: transcriptional repressor [Planctomycetota bacterium]|jgi:Fur family ferric uptake transcriptional regulator
MTTCGDGTPEIDFLRNAGLFEADSVEERAFKLFWKLDRHFTIEEFYRVLRKSGLQLPLESVGSMLSDLVLHGLASEAHFGREHSLRYEPLHIGEHHDHLICIACGDISEFVNAELEEIQSDEAAAKGFKPFRHSLQIFGVCRKCAAVRLVTIPVEEASVGERVRIESCGGDKACVNHLAAIGLREGEVVEVLSASEGGPVILLAGGARVGIGSDLAENIMVCPADVGDRDGETSGEEPDSPERHRRRNRGRHRKGWRKG